ncbi:MAG: hypothetical protein ACLTXM_15465 [Enterococcus sp.]
MKIKPMNPNNAGLFVVGIFTAILLLLRHTLFANIVINYPAVIGLALIIMTMLVSLIVVPKNEKHFWLPKGIGYGWSINPRNALGLFFYLLLVVVFLSALVY